MFGVFEEKCTFQSGSKVITVEAGEPLTFFVDLDSGRYDLFSHPEWRELRFEGALYELQEMVVVDDELVFAADIEVGAGCVPIVLSHV